MKDMTDIELLDAIERAFATVARRFQAANARSAAGAQGPAGGAVAAPRAAATDRADLAGERPSQPVAPGDDC